MTPARAGTTPIARFRSVRDHTERLAAPLTAEDQTVQSMADVSPTKWHRAHTTWFFEAFLLGPSDERYESFDPSYHYLFNSYYEGLGDRHPRADRGLLSRPGIDEIARYRRHVDAAMESWLARGLDPATDTLVTLGLHHEQQHQELLLMDIKHVLGSSPLHPAYDRRTTARSNPRPLVWIEHDGGLCDIGHDGPGFAFDNESPRHTEFVAPFALADRPVTCGEWLAFIDDGGYDRAELWLSEGWAHVVASGWEAPLYWEETAEGWVVHSLHGTDPVDPHRPVCHVSHYESDAYARWAGARLPTETEWEVVAAADARSWAVAAAPRDDLEPFLHPAGIAPLAVGEVWEWTASAYLPYPGFRPAEGAVGEYNGKFMVNQHVLRGASSATPPGHARATYRNFFPSSSRWAFSGLRLARDA